MNQAQEAVNRQCPHILLLEDEPSVAYGLQMILSEEGFPDVDLAMTGHSALDSFKNKTFDLLIADLRLPDIDGMEVIKQVKHDRPDTDVIVITGYSTVDSAVEAMKLGALDFLPKPFTEDEFLAAVKDALSLKRAKETEAVARAPESPAGRAAPKLSLIPEEGYRVDRVMAQVRETFTGKPQEVIPMLQMVQHQLGYLPENALEEIARFTKRSVASIFGVATFYEQFRLAQVGRHVIRVCRGTACHVKGSDRILHEIEARFHLSPGQTSDDRLFSLETVACFGSCAIAPVVVVDEAVKGRMNPSKTCKTLSHLKKHETDLINPQPEKG